MQREPFSKADSYLPGLLGLKARQRGDGGDDLLGGQVSEGHVERDMAILIPGEVEWVELQGEIWIQRIDGLSI